MLCWSCGDSLSIDEVARVPSPSGRIEALVIEANAGSKLSFSHDIYVVPAEEAHSQGVHIASLYGAKRNRESYGVNLIWNGTDELVIQYLEASAADLLQEQASVEGLRVRVILRDRIDDPAAPAGSMSTNSRKRRP